MSGKIPLSMSESSEWILYESIVLWKSWGRCSLLNIPCPQPQPKLELPIGFIGSYKDPTRTDSSRDLARFAREFSLKLTVSLIGIISNIFDLSLSFLLLT